MHRLSSFSIFVVIAGALATAQDSSPRATVSLQQHVTSQCGISLPATVVSRGDYAVVVLHDGNEEVRAFQVSKDDNLLVAPTMEKSVVKLAKKSGFHVQQISTILSSTPEAFGSDKAQCPALSESKQLAQLQREQRLREANSTVFRVGVDGVTPPKVVKTVDPQRPSTDNTSKDKQKRVEGIVVLQAVVDTEGAVQNVKVVRSLDPDLDQNALEAVRSWRFEPARKAGIPVRVLINIEVNFRLHS